MSLLQPAERNSTSGRAPRVSEGWKGFRPRTRRKLLSFLLHQIYVRNPTTVDQCKDPPHHYLEK